jgi:hypothetical protein
MMRKALFGCLATLLLVSCTDTARAYREAMELKKLKPSFTRTEVDDISVKSSLLDITFTGFQDEDGELRRVLAEYEKGDTNWIDDHFYTNNKPLYYTHTEVFNGDTTTSCTCFFHSGKCIKRACAFGDYETEETAEMAMEITFIRMKEFTR